MQSSLPAIDVISPPILTFEGLSNFDNQSVLGLSVLPPDPNGDVGPNHYVQVTNLLVRVFDKSGAPLTPAFRMSSLFASIGGPCFTGDDGDPIVLYDQLADRWLVSQFALPNGSSNPPYHQCIAISQSGDPTGAYFVYDFVMPGNNLNDYPKFGVWPNSYFMTDNQFLNGGLFSGAGVFAFDRQSMLRGEAASYIYFNLALLDPNIGGVLPSDADGLLPPPAGTPGYFAYFTATEFFDPQDGLRIFELDADFDNPAASTFSERLDSPLAVAAFDPLSPFGRADIPQPAPGVAVDSISDRLMHRLQYRNFGTHETLVVNHTVRTNVTPYRAGVRYYELHRSLPGGTFTIPEQATFSPDTSSRWMGSAAMDHQGNLAIGYSVSSSTVFPSIRYAGRLATDPANQLAQGEATLIAGTGVQRDTSSRWGDYSALSVDPTDDCTFWYTTEYYTAAGQAASTRGWQTRIGSFKFAACTALVQGTLRGSITDCRTGAPLAGALVETSGGLSQVTDPLGDYSRKVLPGTYDVTASHPGYANATSSGVVVGVGTTTVDLCLQELPLNLDLSYAAGTLTLDFDLGPTQPVTWNLYANIGNANASLLSAPLPIIAPPLSLPVPIPGFPQIGNVGYLTTFTTAPDGIVASSWETIDTAPPINASCLLDLNLSAAAGTLTMSFSLSSGQAATWNIWIVVQNTAIPILSAPLPALPLIGVPLPIPGFPHVATIGVLTTLTTPSEGIICSDWQTVDTN